MKTILLITASLLLVSAARAEVITESTETATVLPGSAVQWRTSKSYKFLEAGDVDTVEARPGATNRDVIIVAKPLKNGVPSKSASVMALDEDGKLIGILRVEVRPSGRTPNIVTIVRAGVPSYYDCNSSPPCMAVDTSNQPLPDAVTTTQPAGGGGWITKHYNPALAPR